eukprot:gb/GFBE01044922.1/.p1 GENE.gb/GFBE01044922.1/~~gb/GFBE01044922.1/.p1  ORF type:complete len:302 (+),score=34.41 gb/GFBE01044922.1/:1-906(+)
MERNALVLLVCAACFAQGRAIKSCPRLTRAELMMMDLESRAKAFRLPTLVTNVTDHYPDVDDWLHYFDFDSSHPYDPPDEERKDANDAMLLVFKTFYGSPDSFNRSWRLRVSYSASGDDGPRAKARRGVTFCNHGFSWLALLKGTKDWFFAPYSKAKPLENPSCAYSEPGQGDPPAGVLCRLTQRAGEVVVVPTGSWHSTCNFGDVFAFGGEDDCDKTSCKLNNVCPRASLVEKCHGEFGALTAGDFVRPSGFPPMEQAQLVVRSVKPAIWTEYLKMDRPLGVYVYPFTENLPMSKTEDEL